MPHVQDSDATWWKSQNVFIERAACAFQIRPLGEEPGFELTCEGLMQKRVAHRRLIDAIVQAVQLGRNRQGAIHIFDAHGAVAEVLRLPD